jgi:NADPH:quinone reductase-like Zn-dependent oxidoreductase
VKAIVQDRYGPPDTLELRDVDPPRIGDTEVLVRVHAAGVDRGTEHLMTGRPYVARIAIGLRRPKVPVAGMDLAGVVEAVGAAVTRLAPGDEVFGVGRGTFAELAAAPETKLAPKPASLSFEQSAAVPISGITAWEAVRDHGRISAGQRVLITGASGGVGTFAVQLARHAGAHVTGVASTGKIALVRDLGAERVLDHTRDELADERGPFDVILDIGGNTRLSRLRQLLTPRGTLVIVGGEGGGAWLGGIDRQLRAVLRSPFAAQTFRMVVAGEGHEALLALTELIDAGHLTPVVDRTFPLPAAADALRYLGEGRVRGKVVVTI